MRKPSDPPDKKQAIRSELIGLGVQSLRKSYYPELQDRLGELERFKALLDSSNDAIFLIEVPTGNIVDINDSACRQMGWSRQVMLTRSIFSVSELDDCPFAREMIATPQKGPMEREQVTTNLNICGGGVIHVEMNLSSMAFSNTQYVVAVARDIRERLRADQAIHDRTKLAELGSEVGAALTSEKQLHDGLQHCTEALVSFADAVFCRIWVYDQGKEALILQASAGQYTNLHGEFSQIPLGDRLKAGHIAKTLTPHLTNTVPGDPLIPEQDWVEQEGIVSFAGYPLHLAGRLVGVVALFARHPMEQTVLTALASIADVLAVGIERYQGEANLRESLSEVEAGRDKIDAILSSVADGLMVTDAQNRVLMTNHAARLMLSLASDNILGTPLDSLLPASPLLALVVGTASGELHDKTLDCLISQQDSSSQLIVQARSAPVITRSGEITGVVTIFRNVTEDRELDQMKDEFISTAAHELRTPLTTVIGYVELLLNAREYNICTPTQQAECLEMIMAKSEVLSDLVDDLLDLSRIQTGQQLRLRLADHDICQVIRTVVSAFSERANTQHLEMNLPNKAIQVHIDAEKITQALENLLSNAIKFSPQRRPIRVSGRIFGDCFIVSVEDQGIGMTTDQIEKIFDKFYRADSSTTAREGLGLGMTIVKKIITAHQGEIRIDSHPGRGTTTSFTLPLTQ